MLNPEDRRAIEGLFERLRDVAGRTGPRDAEAEALIHERVGEQPAAPYYMAQTILVQETALREARERIAMLEERAEEQGGRTRGPWDRQDRSERAGGGFLAGAAQTALGVTGGVLLGSAIASIFTGGAQAEEPAPEPEPQPEPEPEQDFGGDEGGDWGGFDMGGDF
ncbi:hypothetical protein VE25_05440 [Devosia geojensis]|uniref:ABC transporter substrate-binding protein n=1 Tax=Devosia geojensis TaxID=443610 RepID=A0A0F5FW34_9HYPH|nr:DUF2076 family protein [Devosia geojensis]KKB12785.1 hypothetical protein VE25_05440 [Devosia geojensis]